MFGLRIEMQATSGSPYSWRGAARSSGLPTEARMTDNLTPDTGRLEQILKSVDQFKPMATRRGFMQKLVLAGGGTAIAVASLGKVANVFASSNPVLDFVNAAVGAERIGIAFYGNALGKGSAYSVPGDPATNTLLNSSHRRYFQAAFNQESSHLATLMSKGGKFDFGHFGFPSGTFDSANPMLAMGQNLESIFIGAYLGAVKAGATDCSSLGIFVAEAAAQICGIECEHRVLINDIAGIDPPNDRFYEGDAVAPSGAFGDTGARSVVYATAGDAVNALVGLGIAPSA
jgi:Ferritin-like domain